MAKENTTIDKDKHEAQLHDEDPQVKQEQSAKNPVEETEHQQKNDSENQKTASAENIDEKKDTDENQREQTPAEEELSLEDKLKLEVDLHKDKYLRLFAEFENYKRRTSKERIELFKTAGQDVMQSMLPVLDDFDRALKEIKKSTEDQEAVKGVELIHNKLKDTLKAKGLEELVVNSGDAFDADLHEAITQIPSPTEDLKGKIVDVVEKGYTLGEKIIRYPKVVTGK